MARHNCCNDYTRSQLLRSAAAEAGRGLPAIEVGMPEPAGTGLSRRSFLSWSAGLALAVYGASKIPLAAFEEGIAQAAATDKILVSVFFDGGIDALSVLAPTGDPRYAQLRPNLALAPDAGTEFSEDPTLRWHPSAAGLATLHGEGKVSAFPAIGYDHPDQSHFTSRHYYEIGELDVGFHTGWLGRYIDQVGDDDNPLQGALDGRLALADDRHRRTSGGGDRQRRRLRPLVAGQRADRRRDVQELRPLRLAALRLARAWPRCAAPPPRPTSCAPTSAGIGRLHQPGRLPENELLPQARRPRRLHRRRPADAGGHDPRLGRLRHPRRRGRRPLARPAKRPARGCSPSSATSRRAGSQDRVLIELWSEFGRRPEENGSLGTDHGAAGCAFVVGSKAKGEMVGEFPGLAQLDQNDNVRVTSDFRAMYCSLLEQWLGHDAASVIPGRLLVRAAGPGESVSTAATIRLGDSAPGLRRPHSRRSRRPDSRCSPRPPRRPGRGMRLAAPLQAGRQARAAARPAAAGQAHQALVDLRRPARRPSAHTRPAGCTPAPATPPAGEPSPRSPTSASKRSSTATPSPAPKSSAGEVIVELNNQGEDPHNLVLEHEGTKTRRWKSPRRPRSHRRRHFTLSRHLPPLLQPLQTRGQRHGGDTFQWPLATGAVKKQSLAAPNRNTVLGQISPLASPAGGRRRQVSSRMTPDCPITVGSGSNPAPSAVRPMDGSSRWYSVTGVICVEVPAGWFPAPSPDSTRSGGSCRF